MVTNVDRRLPDGTRHPEENVNKSQIWITTAGWKDSFAFEKLEEFLIASLVDPDDYMILGASYEIPVKEGLLSESFIDQLRLSDTYNEDSFDREYRGIWSGGAENAFYSADKFDLHRTLATPEYDAQLSRAGKDAYYILGVDVGRINCTTEVCIFKVFPQLNGQAIKHLVNIYTYDAEHFEDQAIHLKNLFIRYRARGMVIDANGLGAGLVDFMVKGQTDPNSGEYLPPFGVMNDEDGLYKKFRTPDTILDTMYLMKANAPLNTEMYSYAQVQMTSGKLKFLIDEQEAKTKLMETRTGQQMTPEKRNLYLKPFVQTSILREQCLNLVEDTQGINIILKQSNRAVKKDKFSAFIYGLYLIKQEEERKRKRSHFNISDYMFFSPGR